MVKEEAPSKLYVALWLLLYAACNSQMLVLNKLCVTYIQSPNFVLVCQLGFNALAVYGLGTAGVVECDAITRKKAVQFSPVVLTFVLLLFTNLKAIHLVPVDTFICARASTPCLTAVLEFLLLGRQLPTFQSFLSLLLILFGVLYYYQRDVQFDKLGYMWLGIWYVLSLVENLWVKHIITTLPMSTWGRSLYQNLFSLPFCFLLALSFGELRSIRDQQWSTPAVIYLALSCLAGIAMNYSSFLLRDLISATSFAVVGNVCKLGTIVVNSLIWEKHASREGHLALLITLLGAAFYEQAPYRSSNEGPAEHLKRRCQFPFSGFSSLLQRSFPERRG